MKSNDQKLLKHPLVLQLLELKWKAYGLFVFFLDFIIYCLFLTLLCIYALSLPSSYSFDLKQNNVINSSYCYVLKPELQNSKGYIDFRINPATGCSRACASENSWNQVMKIMLTVVTGMRLLYELIEILYHRWRYGLVSKKI